MRPYYRYLLSIHSLPSHTVAFTVVPSEERYFKFLVKPNMFTFAFCFPLFKNHVTKCLPCSRTWNVFLCYCLEALLFYLQCLSLMIDPGWVFWIWCEVGIIIHYFHMDIELLHHDVLKTSSFLHSRAVSPLLKSRWHVDLFLDGLCSTGLFILTLKSHCLNSSTFK